MTRIRLLNRALYTVAAVGSLAFGATQAFAATGPQQNARYCDTESCWAYCHGPGGCWSGQCICY